MPKAELVTASFPKMHKESWNILPILAQFQVLGTTSLPLGRHCSWAGIGPPPRLLHGRGYPAGGVKPVGRAGGHAVVLHFGSGFGYHFVPVLDLEAIGNGEYVMDKASIQTMHSPDNSPTVASFLRGSASRSNLAPAVAFLRGPEALLRVLYRHWYRYLVLRRPGISEQLAPAGALSAYYYFPLSPLLSASQARNRQQE